MSTIIVGDLRIKASNVPEIQKILTGQGMSGFRVTFKNLPIYPPGSILHLCHNEEKLENIEIISYERLNTAITYVNCELRTMSLDEFRKNTSNRVRYKGWWYDKGIIDFSEKFLV